MAYSPNRAPLSHTKLPQLRDKSAVSTPAISRSLSSTQSLIPLTLSPANPKQSSPPCHERFEGYSLIMKKMDQKLRNYNGRILQRAKASLETVTSKAGPTIRIPKLRQEYKEPTTYSRFIQLTTARRMTSCGVNRGELKQEVVKQSKEEAQHRAILRMCRRRRTTSMPEVASYGSVTSINSFF
jgi:hypothetical protein